MKGITTNGRLSAKRTLAWGALFYVLSQLALDVYMDGWHSEQYDPEFAARMTLLKERIAENPGSP